MTRIDMTPQQLEVETPSDLTFSLPDRTATRSKQSTRYPEKLFENQRLLSKRQTTIRIALAGCGVVGGGLVRLLHESASAIASRFGVRFVITKVLVRDTTRDRKLPIDSKLFTNDLELFLAEDADVVIEAVGGQEPARTIAISALRRGRKLITANKELIAAYGESLHALATANETGLDFGAAVGGSAPVISTLRDLVGACAPRSVRGILNGTSNFLISQLERGASLDAALATACQRGLAEADCSRDLDGSDAAAKLSIIAWIAYGVKPSSLQLRRTSLIPGLPHLVQLSELLGGRVRLIGECTLLGGDRITAAVEPVIVPESSPFARTTCEDNRVEVDLGWTSPLTVSGPGAGGAPTAAALLSDLVRASSPPNDRGVDVAQFVSVPDSREHRWLIGARLAATDLVRLAGAASLQVANSRVAGDYACVVVGPAHWDKTQLLFHELETLNAAPCVARCELFDAEEANQ
ncbi:MAG TPA: homoserine dehydrogenase [Gemmatimonadaceae bacterium]